MSRLRPTGLALLAALIFSACDATTSTDAPKAGASFNANASGVVFTLGNGAANEVLAFRRAADGTLAAAGAFATGGAGGNLGASTDPLVLSADGRFLYAVNNGSNDVSVFQVTGNRLQLRQRVASGGVGPFSLAIRNDLVYVLNAGDGTTAGSLVAFSRAATGRLSAIAGGTYTFSSDMSVAGGLTQVSFDPAGRTAVVTARAADRIFAFPVQADGTPGAPTVNASIGQTPFGFDFDAAGRLYVSNAAGGAPDLSSVSAYGLDGTTLVAIETEVLTTETAACWVRIDGRYAYVTNTGSGTVSGYEILADGSIDLLDADGVTATTGANPRDMNVAGGYLYVQSDGQLDIFAIGADGSLSSVGTTAVPATARGVASR